LFFSKTTKKVEDLPKRFESKIINIYPEISYQRILGFGGAITEASGFAYSKLDSEKKKKFIDDYFSNEGLKYTLARIPIGSCDFSLKSYCYSNKSDLSDFNIEEDKKFLIPLLRDAYNNKTLTLFSSPWSPPRFMKNTKILKFGGKLEAKYRKLYAEYFARYINEYKKEGFDINYINVQNEPNAIQLWESCLYSAQEEADFIINYLYPTLKEKELNTKILICDQNKDIIYNRTKDVLEYENAKEFIDAIGFHYYSGDHFESLKLIKEKYPDKLLIHTEGCTGLSKEENDSHNGEIYAHEIIGDLNSGANGYLDWNIILDSKGGPNHKNNFCNSPIKLNKEENDYVKTPAYYYIGHFSKFIDVGAKRIAFSKYTDNIELTAFKNSDETISVVLLNKKWFDIDFNISIEGKLIKDSIKANSIVTFIIEK